MVTIKNKLAIEKMFTAGQYLAEIFVDLKSQIQAGKSTLQLDQWFEEQLVKKKMVSKCKGYGSYKHVSCISVNDEVVHGVPRSTKILKKGDLVKVDVCASYDGYCADMARCYFVDFCPSDSVASFVEVAKNALDKGIDEMCPGKKLGDISHAIQVEIEKNGYGVVRDFAGHGIGKQMHEDPEVLNYGKAGTGLGLIPGMVFALEPMLTMGSYKVYVDNDGWTARTMDRSLAAHIEDTVAITTTGPKILTRLEGLE
ncbi:type I methionyl aminopeptidase [Candidatus Dependentiae bacterium]|nr:type I methionyl aminopeptidase [Candidatus Dependentiae bacterium]